MNFRKVLKIVGEILIIESLFMLLALIVGLCYKEFSESLDFLISLGATGALGCILTFAIRPKKTNFYAREGFLAVGLCWVMMSLFATLPYLLTGTLTSFTDAFFESVSGFTATGGSVIPNIEAVSHGMIMWRELTHWLGGMGILVFMLAFLPGSGADTIYIYGAETTGYRSDKIVSKMRFTALILYLIYIAFTIIEAALLMFKIPFFDAIIHAMGTASTGGFSNRAMSIQTYNSLYVEIVVMVFMFLNSVNFTLFFLMLLGNFKSVFKNEELRIYVGIVFAAILAVTVSLTVSKTYANFWTSLRFASFQVLTCCTTTGFFSANFTAWPIFAEAVLLLLMMGGGMAGSTAGGIKTSRIGIIAKSTYAEVKKVYRPSHAATVRFEGRTLAEKDVINVKVFIFLYFALLLLSILLLSLLSGATTLENNVSGTISAISGVGPFFGNGTAYAGDFTVFNAAQKIVLCIDMLAGRLELFPILLIFMPRMWRYK